MQHSINLDLSNENVWFSLNTTYRNYELEINNTDGSDINIKLDKGQLDDLLKEMLNNNFFEVDEDGDVCIAEL